MASDGLSLLLCLSVFILCVSGIVEDDMEIESLLRTLNKPAVITFERDGFIIDCVDFYKQAAFDNPLLKNHSIPKEAREIISKRRMTKQMMGADRCPYGTVPIQRVTRQDLLREKSPNGFHFDAVDQSLTSYHTASLRITVNNILGTRALVGIHSPHCVGNQMTGSFIRMLGSVDGNTDIIYAGWAIFPQLYGGDLRPSVTIFWRNRASGTGCFNTLCPGFVQVDAETRPGNYFSLTSVFGGLQYETNVEIHQDVQTKHWWFILDDKKVGYWPKELFSNLDQGATNAIVGGVAISDENNDAPGMGYGNYPSDLISKAGYMRHIEYANATKGAYYPFYSVSEEILTKNCFGFSDLGIGDSNGYTILFGGPGGHYCG